ncbi:Thiamine-phosphate synthase [Candidatus Sulfotelmatobacter kueseliae]|uniref:Thiamine-phosphate synthase n=1 Tax=Candidatus Sulfotelmatobacter kueseliae TaxID=2042962 RepID=A0A2U3KI09_9BACT|nr:Thiamine-phosphate synthase [Candidatus Sulfotelmatobacter kueseliae]
MISLPRLYAILDAGCFPNTQALFAAAEELAGGGCTLLQYRNKSGNARVMLKQARELKKRLGLWSGGRPRPPVSSESVPRTRASGAPQFVRLIMNDRSDLCLAADFDGVHVGQEDLSPESVRKIIGPDRWLGVSTHNPEQIREADQTSADYLAIGPVFPTSSKERPDPVVGLDGVRRARALTHKPLVAIGGITRANVRSVIEAGADSVAMISDLLRDPRKSAEEFFRVLR